MLQIDLNIKRGHFQRHVQFTTQSRVTALFGSSGAGKTTILNAIAGLITPQAGLIKIDGQCLFDHQRGINLPVHQRQIGYVFQEPRLFPHLKVSANLIYGRHRSKDIPRFGFDTVVELLGITELLNRRTQHLSGGEAKRVALGRALLSQPALLLMDEPLSALDQSRREELIPYLQRVRDEIQIPIVYVSHQLDEVERIADVIHYLS